MKKFLIWLVAGVIALAAATYAAFQLSPWPSVMLIRLSFDRETQKISDALEKHVPPGIAEQLDEPYDPRDPDALFDLFRPEGDDRPLPVIVWVHGGAFVYGNKGNVRNYLKVLASKGYATVAVGYSIAPGAHYPEPVRQANRALAHLTANAGRLKIDPTRIFLAGDSAGAQIAAQVSLVVTDPAYATRVGIEPAITSAQLRGVLLMCGAFGTEQLNFEGPFGGFLNTVLWAYSGRKDFMNDPQLKDFSIAANMTPRFPPFFVTVGNADPLAPSSYDLKDRADALGVPNDALFYPKDHTPPLPHEYQFNLDGADGRQALEQALKFLAERSSDTQ